MHFTERHDIDFNNPHGLESRGSTGLLGVSFKYGTLHTNKDGIWLDNGVHLEGKKYIVVFEGLHFEPDSGTYKVAVKLYKWLLKNGGK